MSAAVPGGIAVPGTVVVTGASGQVGGAVVRLLSRAHPDLRVLAPGRSEFDLASGGSIRSFIQRAAPRWIISCAAYTGVDAAESDRDAAFTINGNAPGVLAEEAAAAGAGLIHFSTDYVFDGSGNRPWVESDATNPLGVYGASKLAGEQIIAAVADRTGPPYVILRTSWVYSGGGKNFVRTMLRLLSTRTEPLHVVADQHGAPTSAADLAAAVLTIVQAAETEAAGGSLGGCLPSSRGVYHCAAAGETTWAGLADAVRGFLRLTRGMEPPEILPVSTAEYPTPARRPLNSRLNCEEIAGNFGVHLPDWRSSLGDALRILAETDLPSR